MTQYVNLKASGDLLIHLDGFVVITSYDDPLLPSAVASAIAQTHISLGMIGASQIHMERDTFRTFTHTTIGGLVTHSDSIVEASFFVIEAERAALEAAYNPTITEEVAQ